MKKIHACLLIISVLSAVTLNAAEPKYFLGDPDAMIAKLPPPPADDSPAGMADMETLLQVQKDRTPAQVARAELAAKHDCMIMGAEVFGPAFTKENLPATYERLLAMTLERRAVLLKAKKLWNRVRPYHRGLGIEPCVYDPGDASYPSGHSAAASLWAVLYSELFPEYRKIFVDIARERIWCRVLGGAHYPSDTQAGSMLGEWIAKDMLKNPVTQKALDEMRAELAEFFKKHPDALRHAKTYAKKAADIAKPSK